MDNNLKIDVSQEYPVSKEQLYKAWTQPEELKQWWKPLGKQLSQVNNDLKEGGLVEYIFEDGSLTIRGKYLEVKEQEKLVYTWNWALSNNPVEDGDYKLTVLFQENGDGSRLSVSQDNFKDEQGIQPHQQGWTKALEDLKQYLQQNSANGNSASGNTASQQKQKPEISGYNETPEQLKVAGG